MSRVTRVAPASVGDALASAHQALDARTRQLMETRLGGAAAASRHTGARSPGDTARLRVGEPADAAERRADAAAHAAMQPAAATVPAGARADFSQVRVHAGARAAASARALDARAYAVGNDLVFDTDEFAPHTLDGQRLLAHELAHVAQAEPGVLRRELHPGRSAAGDTFEFRAGHELTEPFMTRAQRLTADGSLSDADIAALKADSITASETVNDHERMFMAGLLDPANVRALRGLRINATASITFALASITETRVKHVIEASHPAVPANVQRPADAALRAFAAGDFGTGVVNVAEAEMRAVDQMRALVGTALRARFDKVLAFAYAANVSRVGMLMAMTLAASDDAPSDRLVAAAAYLTLKAAGMPMADDLVNGKVHVDALEPARFRALPGVFGSTVALYLGAASINPTLAGMKGDTVYLQDNYDIDNLADRSQVIHEMRHAQDDKAQGTTAAPAMVLQQDLEVTAYRAQARYILDQMAAQDTAGRAVSATQIGGNIGSLPFWGVVLEAHADLTKYQPIVEQLFAAAPAPLHLEKAQVDNVLAAPVARVESLMRAEILSTYHIAATSKNMLDGQSGESLVNWIRRL